MHKYTTWIYWLITVSFLGTSLMLWRDAIFLAILTNLILAIHYFLREPKITSFPMQVRLGYLSLLILGLAPFFGWVHWVQFIGGSIMLTTDYCPLARMLSLLPWNRNQPMSGSLIRTILFTPPVSGCFNQVVKTEQPT